MACKQNWTAAAPQFEPLTIVDSYCSEYRSLDCHIENGLSRSCMMNMSVLYIKIVIMFTAIQFHGNSSSGRWIRTTSSVLCFQRTEKPIKLSRYQVIIHTIDLANTYKHNTYFNTFWNSIVDSAHLFIVLISHSNYLDNFRTV